MKTLFTADALHEIIHRIDALQPTSERLWGKMNVAQMMAHCSTTLEVAIGQKTPPRLFIGRILGPFFKSSFSNDASYSKNSPTDKSFIVSDERNFQAEKDTVKQLITAFAEGGEAKCTTHPHSFFGQLTQQEWGKGMYKHLDHHLQQFGV